jgi:hypothetical protein
VKPDVETLSTVPEEPPAAGPDRALDPPPPGANPPPPGANGAERDVATVAVPEPLLAVALTMPYAPPPSAMVAAPIAMNLVSLRENMN